MNNDLKRLIHEYQKSKAETALTYERMMASEPELRELWRKVQAVRSAVVQRIRDGHTPNPDDLLIAIHGPDIVRAAFNQNSEDWDVKSQALAEQLSAIMKRLKPNEEP